MTWQPSQAILRRRSIGKWLNGGEIAGYARYLSCHSVFKPTGRANARPMTGSVDTGSREENASK
jgi:hypothetical protein